MSVVDRMTSGPEVNRIYDDQAFSYRPIPVLVPVSLGFIFLSFAGAMLAELLIIPAIGAMLALVALRQISQSQGCLSGRLLGQIAFISQVLILIGFGGFHAYMFGTEVPPGYERVNFTSDISKKGFSNQNGIQSVHPDVQKLSNKKVMIKGYMYPSKQERGLMSFVLCRDSGQCCFGGQPKTTDMILVQMNGDRPVNYRQGLVSVAGEFLVESTIDESGLQPLYQLKCDYFGLAKTWY